MNSAMSFLAHGGNAEGIHGILHATADPVRYSTEAATPYRHNGSRRRPPHHAEGAGRGPRGGPRSRDPPSSGDICAAQCRLTQDGCIHQFLRFLQRVKRGLPVNPILQGLPMKVVDMDLPNVMLSLYM
ncbi:hypothetical protein ACP70R_029925 [Stipagrostis hirtigluma subsp. patula]